MRQITKYLLSFILLATVIAPTSAQWLSGWKYRKAITLDGTKITGNHTDFPVLIQLNDPDLRFFENGGKVAQLDGFDITFTTGDGLSPILQTIEHFDPGTGELTAWVRVTLTDNTSETLFMYFGNPSAVNPQEGSIFWAFDTEGRWTFDNNLFDDTGNGHDGSCTTCPAYVNGLIGNGAQFDGVDDYFTALPAHFAGTGQFFTVSAWVNVPSSAVSDGGIVGVYPGGPQNQYALSFDAGAGAEAAFTIFSGTPQEAQTAGFNTDTWHYIVGVVNGNNASIYLDGQIMGSSPTFSNIATSSANLEFGVMDRSFSAKYFQGVMDEVRIIPSARNADWIETEYNNLGDPTNFYNVGILETPFVWTGTTNNSWNTGSNWLGGAAPISAEDVTIGFSANGNYPILDVSPLVGDLTIEAGASLDLNGEALTILGATTIDGFLVANTGSLFFEGPSDQTLDAAGPLLVNSLRINNGAFLYLNTDVEIIAGLDLASGYIRLGLNDLIIAETGMINGGGLGSYVNTNGEGRLVQKGLGPNGRSGEIWFPIGQSYFAPASIENLGDDDDFAIAVFDGVLENGIFGTILTEDAVNHTWMIDEAVVGGSNVTLKLQWDGINELTGFDGSSAYISHYDAYWDPITPESAASSSGNDYTLAASGVSDFSPFAVASNPSILVSGSVISSYPYCQSFEADLGVWVNSTNDDIDWIRTKAATPSPDTGPNATDEGSYYLYVEGDGNSNSTAELVSETTFDFSAVTRPQVGVRYHLFGSDIGSLTLNVNGDDIWSISGEQQGSADAEWIEWYIELGAYTGLQNVDISFRAETGPGPNSDIAIDYICVGDFLVCSIEGGTIDAPFTTIFEGESVDLSLSGQEPGSTLQWQESTDGMDFTDIGGQTEADFTAAPTRDTYYRVAVDGGCLYWNDPILITVIPAECIGYHAGDIVPLDANIPEGETITLNLADYDDGNIQWQYSTDFINFLDLDNATATSYTTTPLDVDTWFRVILDNGVCSDTSDAAFIVVDPILPPDECSAIDPGYIDATDFVVVSGENVSLSLLDNDLGDIQWQVSSDDLNYDDITAANGSTFVTGSLDAEVFYRVELTLDTCVVYTEPALITVLPEECADFSAGEIIASSEIINPGSLLTLELSGQSDGVIEWGASPDGIDFFPLGVSGPTFATDFIDEDAYFQALVDDGVCFDFTDVIFIEINDRPTDIRISNLQFASTESIDFAVGTLSTIDDNANDKHEYTLVAGDGDDHNNRFRIFENRLLTAAQFDNSFPDMLSIRIRTTDSGGLFFEKEFKLELDKDGELPLEIPTAFTPDNDGVNDTWNIGNIELHPEASVTIFNNNGKQIFSSIGYEQPWDGTHNGRQLPIDTYYYIIKTNSPSDNSRKGTVMIIK